MHYLLAALSFLLAAGQVWQRRHDRAAPITGPYAHIDSEQPLAIRGLWTQDSPAVVVIEDVEVMPPHAAPVLVEEKKSTAAG
jgi:hypothetical protein